MAHPEAGLRYITTGTLSDIADVRLNETIVVRDDSHLNVDRRFLSHRLDYLPSIVVPPALEMFVRPSLRIPTHRSTPDELLVDGWLERNPAHSPSVLSLMTQS